MAKIKFHPFFVIYVFICLYLGWTNVIFYYVLAVVLHEYGHYFVAKVLGYQSQGITFNVFGAGLNNNNTFKKTDDIKISIAGPLVNLFLIIINICAWWLYPVSYIYTLEFVKCNIVVMLFNLIPVYPLDGGRILVCLLETKFNRKKIIKVTNIFACIVGIFLVILFIISIFININFSFLFSGFFLILNSINTNNNLYYEKVKSFSKDIHKIQEIKMFKVDTFNKTELLKYINSNYYSIFVKIDNSGTKLLPEDKLF